MCVSVYLFVVVASVPCEVIHVFSLSFLFLQLNCATTTATVESQQLAQLAINQPQQQQQRNKNNNKRQDSEATEEAV